MLLDEVMTLGEAAATYGKADNTLRINIRQGKFKEGIDCRKSGGTWIILKSALDREYKN
ncbi:MAG: helix-turn-helix domain-containing protein [Paraclostridium sp.]